jgi:hypothetical protein
VQDGCDVRAHGVMCVHGPCMHGWVKWVGEMGVGCTGPECYEIPVCCCRSVCHYILH